MKRSTSLAAALALVAVPASAQTFFDDFNDGNDAGWTRYDLTAVGMSGTWSFPSGAYRLQSGPSPNPAAFGTARLGSVAPPPADVNTAFFASMDLVDYQRPIGTVHGIGFYLRELGLGTTDGYFLWLATNTSGTSFIIFNRIENEAALPLGSGSAALAISPGMDLRLTVEVSGGTFIGRVYDLAAPAVQLATIVEVDTTYDQGSTGVVLAGLTSPILTNPTLDGKVDNFLVIPGLRCQADLTHGAVPSAAMYAVPDGVLNNDDFFFYLAEFAAGNLFVGDITTAAVPGSPGYGVPNGILNNEDFFYYLTIFNGGC